MINRLPDLLPDAGATCADPATQTAGLLDRWANGASPAAVERAARPTCAAPAADAVSRFLAGETVDDVYVALRSDALTVEQQIREALATRDQVAEAQDERVRWHDIAVQAAHQAGCRPGDLFSKVRDMRRDLAHFEAEAERLEGEVARLSGGAVANELARLLAEAREVRQVAGLPDGAHAAVVAEILLVRCERDALRDLAAAARDLVGGVTYTDKPGEREAALAEKLRAFEQARSVDRAVVDLVREEVERRNLGGADLLGAVRRMLDADREEYEQIAECLEVAGVDQPADLAAWCRKVKDDLERAATAKRTLDAAQVACPSSLGYPDHRACVDAFADLERALQATPGGAEAVAAAKGRVGLLQLAAERLRSLAERAGRLMPGDKVRHRRADFGIGEVVDVWGTGANVCWPDNAHFRSGVDNHDLCDLERVDPAPEPNGPNGPDELRVLAHLSAPETAPLPLPADLTAAEVPARSVVRDERTLTQVAHVRSDRSYTWLRDFGQHEVGMLGTFDRAGGDDDRWAVLARDVPDAEEPATVEADLDLRTVRLTGAELERLRGPAVLPAPSHTDLMVAPEAVGDLPDTAPMAPAPDRNGAWATDLVVRIYNITDPQTLREAVGEQLADEIEQFARGPGEADEPAASQAPSNGVYARWADAPAGSLLRDRDGDVWHLRSDRRRNLVWWLGEVDIDDNYCSADDSHTFAPFTLVVTGAPDLLTEEYLCAVLGLQVGDDVRAAPGSLERGDDNLRAALPRVVEWSELQPGDLALDVDADPVDYCPLVLVRKSGRYQWRDDATGERQFSGTLTLAGLRRTSAATGSPLPPRAVLLARGVKANAAIVRRAWEDVADRARALADEARQAAPEVLPRAVKWADLEPGDLALDLGDETGAPLARMERNGRLTWRQACGRLWARDSLNSNSGAPYGVEYPEWAILLARGVPKRASAIRAARAAVREQAEQLAEQVRRDA